MAWLRRMGPRLRGDDSNKLRKYQDQNGTSPTTAVRSIRRRSG
jgi:hypothetical protein